MSETQSRNEEAENENEYVRVDIKDKSEIEEPPYFYSPYPTRLVQVLEGNTPGQKRVIQMINEHWPMSVDELEEVSEEQGDGYTGTFIRSVLRNHYMPQDRLRTDDSNQEETESLEENLEVETGVTAVSEDENDRWHKLFRIGIRAALEADLSEEKAHEAFGSGYIEGKKLGQEIDADILRSMKSGRE